MQLPVWGDLAVAAVPCSGFQGRGVREMQRRYPTSTLSAPTEQGAAITVCCAAAQRITWLSRLAGFPAH